MKKVNVSTKNIGKFAGKWVAIDTNKSRIIAVGETLKDIEPMVSRPRGSKTPDEKLPAAFKVPYKDEGHYILCLRNKTC